MLIVVINSRGVISNVLVSNLLPYCSGELQELLDAELSACIFQLINVTDNGAHRWVRSCRDNILGYM